MKTINCRVQVFDQAYRLEIGEPGNELMIRWTDLEFLQVINQFQKAFKSERSLSVFELPAGELFERKEQGNREAE